MKNLISLASLLFFASGISAQNALITLRDSVKIKTEVTSVSDKYLQTKAGTLGTNEIYSIRFENESEFDRNPELSRQLLATDILVYVDHKKLVSTKPTETILDVAPQESPREKRKAYEVPLREPDQVVINKEGLADNLEETILALGLGAGINYGGLGVRFTYFVERRVGLFTSVGYTMVSLGSNSGIIGRLHPDRKFSPTFSVMYGYNAVIKINGPISNDSKLYYGPSIGLGIDSRASAKNMNYWNFEIVLPFRPAQYDRDIAVLKQNGNISSNAFVLPVLITGGYHFAVGKSAGKSK